MSATRASFAAVCRTATPSKPPPTSRPQPAGAGPERDVLGRYRDRVGRPREIVIRPGAGGSLLVIDRDPGTLSDRRLVAHLAADEPAANAALVCEHYLADCRRCRPRPVSTADLETVPFRGALGADDEDDAQPERTGRDPRVPLHDELGSVYRLERVATNAMAIPELRWLREPQHGRLGAAELVSVREVIGRLEDYEPVRSLSVRAVRLLRDDPSVSVAVLRAELERVAASRIVLNRRLRHAVLEAVARDGLSMSQIAVRCGRVKRDTRGNISGETSWLARRLGLLAEGGEPAPTPWIHSDVLALIARRGLGLSPLEVELA
jgi:hypothetical protein